MAAVLRHRSSVPARFSALIAGLSAVLWLGFTIPSRAASVSIWDGSDSGNWSGAGNWVFNGRPADGNDVVFPPGPSRLMTTNDITGLTVNMVTFSGAGYRVFGTTSIQLPEINVTHGSGTTRMDMDMLAAGLLLRFSVSDPAATLELSGRVYSGNTFIFTGAGTTHGTGVIRTPGGNVFKEGTGTLMLSTSNDLTGARIVVSNGVLRVLHQFALGLSNGSVNIRPGTVLEMPNAIAMPKPGVLAGTLHCFSGANWNGPMVLEGATPRVIVETNFLRVFGVISGTGSLTKEGSGTLELETTNTYFGTTVVESGPLLVNGAQPQNIVQLNAGTLGGTGHVGQVFATGTASKTVNPGLTSPGFNIGILTTSNVLFNSFTRLETELNGPTPGAGHDQLNVRGTVNLGNSQFAPLSGPGLAIGQVLRIINNDGTDAVVGQFTGLPEGASTTVSNGMQLRITYVGGDGNDVELAVMNPPSTITQISRTPQNFIQIAGRGRANVLYTLEGSTTLLPGSWMVVAVDLADAAGLYDFIDVDAPSYSRRFYRVSSP